MKIIIPKKVFENDFIPFYGKREILCQFSKFLVNLKCVVNERRKEYWQFKKISNLKKKEKNSAINLV